ncbi:alpha/beta fold hydrolase [Nocardioidaceae bacterium]|nr:alpha/beta fold hydrolase [Nocardioidaceae bacterium]
MSGGYALTGVRVPRRVSAAVVVLHGGAAPARGVRTATTRTQLSVVRLVPTAWWIAWRTRRAGVAVYRQRNTWRGWDEQRGPVQDVRASLRTLAERHGDVPVALVGHSLGGRTALVAAQDDRVRAVVGLNAYVYDSDAPQLAGRRVLLVHGTDDRVADPAKVRRLAERLRREGADVSVEDVPGGTHGMVGHPRSFDGAAASFVAAWARESGSRAQ